MLVLENKAEIWNVFMRQKLLVLYVHRIPLSNQLIIRLSVQSCLGPFFALA